MIRSNAFQSVVSMWTGRVHGDHAGIPAEAQSGFYYVPRVTTSKQNLRTESSQGD